MLNKQELDIISATLHQLRESGEYWGVHAHFIKHLDNSITKVDAMYELLAKIEKENKWNIE